MLRITAYAERLIRDLDHLDWPEPVKTMQRNWIGPSDGAKIQFRAASPDGAVVRAFTTRPDTLPGATYVVLAPEHPMVDELTAAVSEGTPAGWRYPEAGNQTPRGAVGAYRDRAARLSDRQRSGDTGDKTGVFTGSYVVNPMTGEPVPVFIADYVLVAYGSGAVMAVPAHDQRDLEFASRFGLPVRPVWSCRRNGLPSTACLPIAPRADGRGRPARAATSTWAWPGSAAPAEASRDRGRRRLAGIGRDWAAPAFLPAA